MDNRDLKKKERKKENGTGPTPFERARRVLSKGTRVKFWFISWKQLQPDEVINCLSIRTRGKRDECNSKKTVSVRTRRPKYQRVNGWAKGKRGQRELRRCFEKDNIVTAKKQNSSHCKGIYYSRQKQKT